MKKNSKLLFKSKNFLTYDYIWCKENPISYITESFQKFLANLEYVNVDKKYQVIQITSSLTREGKTTFISNVAYLLGQKGYKTILIDLDLRKPKIHRMYNIENSIGLTDVLSEKAELDKAIKKNKNIGFDVLLSGEKTTAVVNVIQSEKMMNLINKLREKYDYILIDSPPVINVSDALYISKLSDTLVFSIAQKVAKRAVVKEAINLLRQNEINIMGIVMTQVDLTRNKYGYGYGYGYGYDYSYEDDID